MPVARPKACTALKYTNPCQKTRQASHCPYSKYPSDHPVGHRLKPYSGFPRAECQSWCLRRLCQLWLLRPQIGKNRKHPLHYTDRSTCKPGCYGNISKLLHRLPCHHLPLFPSWARRRQLYQRQRIYRRRFHLQGQLGKPNHQRCRLPLPSKSWKFQTDLQYPRFGDLSEWPWLEIEGFLHSKSLRWSKRTELIELGVLHRPRLLP